MNRSGNGGGENYQDWFRERREAGLRALAAGQTDVAIKALRQAVDLLRQAIKVSGSIRPPQPELAEAYLDLGRAFERAHKIEAARRSYQEASNLNPASRVAQTAASAMDALPPPPPSCDDFEPRQTLRSHVTDNTYTVLSVTGGAYGSVYIVQDERDGETYALKTFQAGYLWKDQDRERFRREAATWLLLDHHPHIVSALWTEQIEGFPCLVLEYVDGGTLKDRLGGEALPLPQALRLAMQFCDAMAYASRKLGIVHRDIKPENCLLTASGTLKVTDFGLARAFGKATEGGHGLSELGSDGRPAYTMPLGTWPYIAPEQDRYEALLDARADIHAFGVMLYEMLTGALPRPKADLRLALRRGVDNYNLPRSVGKLILRCIQLNPDRRPPHFDNVRAALASAYRENTGLPPPPPESPTPLAVEDWQNKAVGLQIIELNEEALFCYDSALQLTRYNPFLWKGRSAALYSLRRYPEALAAAEQGLALAPRDSGLWNNKGLAKFGLNDLRGAVVCYNEALKLKPHDPDVLGNKGKALHAQSKLKEAIACYDEGLIAAPRHVGLLEKKGLVLLKLINYEAALECFERGLRYAPREYGLWKGMAVALHNLGDYGQALNACEHGIEINPYDPEMYGIEARTLLKLGRVKEALACFDEGLQVSLDSGDLLKGKGAALYLLQRADEAIECFEHALEINWNDSALHKNLGTALYDKGKYEEALEAFNNGLDINAHDPFLWENKGLVLVAMGKYDEALACYEEGLKLAPQSDSLLRYRKEALTKRLKAGGAKRRSP